MAVRKKSTAKRSKPSQASATSAPRSRSRKQTSRSSRTSTTKSNGFTVDGLIKDFTPVFGAVAGFAIASFLDKKFTTPTATAVAGLAGLEGTDANKFVKPVLVVGVGYALKHFVKHEMAQHASLGVMAYGGLNLASAVMGKTISLSGIEDEVVPKQIGSNESDLDKAIAEALKASTPVKGIGAECAPVASVEGLQSIGEIAPETIGDLSPETIGALDPETIGAYDEIGSIDGDDYVAGLDENGNPQAW